MDPLTLTSLTGISGAAATTALVWVVREALAWSPSKWKRAAPALAIILGIVWNWIAFSALQPENSQPWLVILFGLMSGFAASGIWSGGKNALVEPARDAKVLEERLKRYVHSDR